MADSECSPRAQRARPTVRGAGGHGDVRSGFLHLVFNAAALLLVLATAACAGYRYDGGYDADRSADLFAAGYKELAEVYIDEVETRDLALAALRGSLAEDPALALKLEDERLRLLVEEEAVGGGFALPRRDDIKGWGAVTAAVLASARQVSPVLGEIPAEDLYALAFEGAMGELDGFSRYTPRGEQAEAKGLAGIGVRVQHSGEGMQVLSVVEGSPAHRAGLRSGDTIVAVDGEHARSMPQREFVSRLLGPVNSTVELDVVRAREPGPLRLPVTRAPVGPEKVSARRIGGVAYIRISSFEENTASQLRREVRLARQDPELRGYVVDLRGNPGGLLNQAVAVADVFIVDSPIVATEGRHRDSGQTFEAGHYDLARGLPVIVLLNGFSASASEIVASAIQDSGRGIAIGSSSYGKGSVQTLQRLPGGRELMLTWARFHAPSGYALSGRGVLPDVCTSGHHGSVQAVMTGLRLGSFPFPQQLRIAKIDPADDKAVNTFRAKCPAAMEEKRLDLAVAMKLLERPDLYRLAAGTSASRLAERSD